VTSRLDTVAAAETPEGIELPLRCAGFAARAGAYLIDALIRVAILYGVMIVAVFLGAVRNAVLFIAVFLLNWLYSVVFELRAGAATPGKRALGLQVVMDNGLPITPAASFIRNLLRAVDLLPLCYGFGLIGIIFRADNKRIGDLAAGTLVVYRSPVSPPVALPAAEPQAPSQDLPATAQAAVISFAMRVPRLTPERAQELASLAQAVTGPSPPQAAMTTARLLSAAQWLAGNRRVRAVAAPPQAFP
jgi:uncharacterized RDD family membrane protein YckC